MFARVEVTGVTPFSQPALDRGLAGTLVALARLGHALLNLPLAAERIVDERQQLEFVVDTIKQRAGSGVARWRVRRLARRDYEALGLESKRMTWNDLLETPSSCDEITRDVVAAGVHRHSLHCPLNWFNALRPSALRVLCANDAVPRACQAPD